MIGIASESHHDWLRSVGVTPVAYGDGLADRIRAAARQVDAFIDLYGPDYVDLALELGVGPDRIETIIAFQAAQEHGTKAAGSADAATPEVLAGLAAFVAEGRLTVPVTGSYPLDDVREAFNALADGHTHGNIVLIP